MNAGVAPVRTDDGVVHWSFFDPYVLASLSRDNNTMTYSTTLCGTWASQLADNTVVTCVACVARRGNVREASCA